MGPYNLQMASIDHAMWFHRPARVDEWLLYVMESPNAGGARGLARGSIYSRDGRLVGIERDFYARLDRFYRGFRAEAKAG